MLSFDENVFHILISKETKEMESSFFVLKKTYKISLTGFLIIYLNPFSCFPSSFLLCHSCLKENWSSFFVVLVFLSYLTFHCLFPSSLSVSLLFFVVLMKGLSSSIVRHKIMKTTCKSRKQILSLAIIMDATRNRKRKRVRTRKTRNAGNCRETH